VEDLLDRVCLSVAVGEEPRIPRGGVRVILTDGVSLRGLLMGLGGGAGPASFSAADF